MKTKLSNLFKKKFVRNVMILASGTAGAQALGMAFSPIITRMYGPEAYGMMGTFTSMANIVIPIAALSYPIAIVLPKDNRDAKGIIRLSFLITIILSSISLIILLFFKNSIISLFNIKAIGNFIFLIPLVVVFAGFMQVMEQWLIRTKQFSINAGADLFQSLLLNLGKVGIGVFYPFAAVLVVITAFNNGVKGFFMFKFNKKTIRNIDNDIIYNKKQIKQLAKSYYDFPLYRAPQQLINAISQNMPVILLTTFFGPASAGFYTIGRTVLNLPTRLIGKAVGDVFYPRITEAVNKKEDATNLLKKATLSLAGVGLIPFGIIILFGPLLFSFVFGHEWSIAGEYARWLAFWTYFMFMNRPSVHALPALSAQLFHLKFTIINLIVRLSALSIGFLLFKSDLVSVALFGISGGLANIALIAFTLNFSKKISH